MGLIFIIFCAGLCAACGYGWYFGNPRLLAVGWDTDLHGCGLSNETKDFPMLYWPIMPTLN